MATTGARSIAKDISRREPLEAPDGEDDQAHEEQRREDSQADEEPDSQGDGEQPPTLEANEDSDAHANEEQSDFEANMYELQADLGKEWILHFSVQGDRGWLTAERQDGAQRVEAPDAKRLVTIIDAIDECGGRQP